MAGNKDSAEVVSFLSLYAKLKDWVDDDPNGLIELASEDDGVQQLCLSLSTAAFFLSDAERRSRFLFTNVDPKFLTAWREYEARYEAVVSDVVWSHLTDDLDLPSGQPADQDGIQSSSRSHFEHQWEVADSRAQEDASAIEGAIDFAYEQATQDHRSFPADFPESIEAGVDAWTNLKGQTGLDLRGIFRRRALVPFVLVPRHVAERIGSSEKLSLYRKLREAHEAFIFGTPFAALAMMRSVLELVLRDYYGAKGDRLQDLIQSSNNRLLPAGASGHCLHQLKKWANTVLHESRVPPDQNRDFESRSLEITIVKQLFVLRDLIEGTPTRPQG